ncbi:Retrotransposon gag protein [Salix suchowensis]|nr:Retrotransposon gag protein [Salix suchowensis]
MTETTSLEDQVANLTKLVEGLSTSLKTKDHEIAKLMNKLESMNERGQTSTNKAFQVDQLDVIEESAIGAVENIRGITDGIFTTNQLKELIKEAITDQVESSIQPSYSYVKPYTQRIDLLKMPLSYQPPKFQQFDGKGNPRQHIAHFVETCNNAGTNGDLMVKQFSCSIDTWEQLEREFLNRFYSTRRVVSMIELTNARIKPKSFEELATRAHDMELSIAAAESSSLPMQEPERNKPEGRRFGKSTLKVEGKQSLVVNSTAIREKVYPFPDSDISRMLDDLLEVNIIELPEVKRPEEANQVDNPNYCKYHRLISHPVEKCFVLKDKIMRLHENGDIVFDDEVAASNITTTVKSGPCQSLSTISFGSCEPIRLDAIFPMSSTVSSIRNEVFSAQSIRKPVTLNEYMPTEMKRIENVPVACYQVDEEKTPIDHDDSSNLSHGVYTTEISFNDEDLLLGSKLHNRPLFIKGYVDGKIVNRILVDDGSAVNILPLKTMRELGIPMDELFPRHLMIQGFNQEGLSNEDNVRLRLEELEALDDKRLEAQQRLECYQARLCRAFNKKVRPRSFQEGDLVLAVRRPIIMSKRMGSKFLSKWDGPYVVQEVYTNGAYKIVDENGLRIGPINGKFLKRYYA